MKKYDDNLCTKPFLGDFHRKSLIRRKNDAKNDNVFIILKVDVQELVSERLPP